MAKKDVAELQRRMKPDAHNITYLAGCLVEPDGEITSIFKERLVGMREEEYHKYLDRIRGIFAYKKYGDNIAEADILYVGQPMELLLKTAIESEMKDDDVIEAIFKLVRAAVSDGKRYAILVWNDIYDIVKTDKNNESLDESEETLNYIGCMICPVNMDKEGLAYSPIEGKFVAKERAWVMGAPEFAFLWPSFTDRSPNPDAYTVYVGNPADVPHDFISSDLGCKPFLTRTEVQKIFEHAVLLGPDDPDDVKPVLEMVNYKLEQMLGQSDDTLDQEQMKDLLTFAGVKGYTAERIARAYAQVFHDVPQKIGDLYVKKYAAAYAARMKVLEIKQKLNQAADALDSMTDGQSEELTLDIRRVAAGL